MRTELYWIEGPWLSRLAIMPRPRGGDWLEDEITSWRHVGIDTIVSALMKEESTEELRAFLNNRFHIAVRVRNIRDGLGYRVYQVQKPKNRHLIDVRPVESLPPCQRVEEVLVVTPPELIAGKVMAWTRAPGQAQGRLGLAGFGHAAVDVSRIKDSGGACSGTSPRRRRIGGSDGGLEGIACAGNSPRRRRRRVRRLNEAFFDTRL